MRKGERERAWTEEKKKGDGGRDCQQKKRASVRVCERESLTVTYVGKVVGKPGRQAKVSGGEGRLQEREGYSVKRKKGKKEDGTGW